MGWFSKVRALADDFLGTKPAAARNPPPPVVQQEQARHEPPPQHEPPPLRDSSQLSSGRPLVAEMPSLDGGTQSLTDVRERMMVDDEGDEAHDFIEIDKRS